MLTKISSSRILCVQTIAPPIFSVFDTVASVKADVFSRATNIDLMLAEKSRKSIRTHAMLERMTVHSLVNQMAKVFEIGEKTEVFESLFAFSVVFAL